MRKILQIILPEMVLFCLTALVFAVLIRCDQAYDNPVSDKYVGDYKCEVLWDQLSDDTLEILKKYTFSVKDVGKDKFFEFNLQTEPRVNFRFYKVNSKKSGTHSFDIVFLQPFDGKLIVNAIRPNQENIFYDTIISVSNPFVIKGDNLSGKNVPAKVYIARTDDKKIQNSSVLTVCWRTGSKCFSSGSIVEAASVKYANHDTVRVSAFLYLSKEDSSEIGTFKILFKGNAPEIKSAFLQDTLRLGQAPHVKVGFTCDDTGSVYFMVHADSHEKVLTSIPVVTDSLNILICDQIISDTSVTSISIVATCGNLSSSPFLIKDQKVSFKLPDVEFLASSDTVVFRYGEHPKFRASGVADSFIWSVDDGLFTDTTSVDSLVLGKITDTMYHVITLTGMDRFGLKCEPDKIFYRARDTRYSIDTTEITFPSEILIGKQSCWKVRTIDKYGKEISDSVKYVWKYPSKYEPLFSEDSSGICLILKDSVQAFNIQVFSIVGTALLDTTVPFEEKVTTRIFRPVCTFNYDSTDSVMLMDSLTLGVTAVDTDPDGYINAVYYSVNSDAVDIVEKRGVGEVWGYRFKNKGQHTIKAWAEDDLGNISFKDSLIFYITTDKPVFTYDTVDTLIYIGDTLVLTGIVENDLDSIENFLWDFDNNNSYDSVTDTNSIKRYFPEAGIFSINLSCVNISEDFAAMPMTFNVKVLKGIPVIDSVVHVQSLFINDICIFEINAKDSGTNGSIAQYLVSSDNIKYRPLNDSAFDTVYNSTGWKHLYFKVKDNLNQFSNVYYDSVFVEPGMPVVDDVEVEFAGEILYVRDTFTIKYQASDPNGFIRKAYVSYNNDSIPEDSLLIDGQLKTHSGLFEYAFDTSSYGIRTVRVWVTDEDNVKSLVYNKTVSVRKGIPVIQSVTPKETWVMDSTLFTVSVADTNSKLTDLHTEMSMDSGKTWKAVVNGVVSFTFDTTQAGKRIMIARVTDSDSIVTLQQSTFVVNMGRPSLGGWQNYGNNRITWFKGATSAPDTMAYAWDNIGLSIVVVDTSDSNGQCKKYFWDWENNSYTDDTTTIPSLTKIVLPHTASKVTVTTVDNDGIPSFPYTFVAFPDQVPEAPTTILSSIKGDSVVFEWTRKLDSYDGIKTRVQFNLCDGGGCDPVTPLFNNALPTIEEIEIKYGITNRGGIDYNRFIFKCNFSGVGRWKVVLVDSHDNQASSETNNFEAP